MNQSSPYTYRALSSSPSSSNETNQTISGAENHTHKSHKDINKSSNFQTHSICILNGLHYLQTNKILCDVVLIAEDKKFPVHRVIMASCSDYFRSMFTSGMKESTQSEIELKGVTSRGLQKSIEVIYTSHTTLEGDDIFELIAAATHLQIIPVIEFCENNFLVGMNSRNFNYFIQTAKLYHMEKALKQIDLFIVRHLDEIANRQSLKLLSYEQLLNSISNEALRLREIEIFSLVWRWLNDNKITETNNNNNNTGEYTIKIMRELMAKIRFALISPQDLIEKVQSVSDIMSDQYCRDMVLKALNYHLMPHSQSSQSELNNEIRSPLHSIICIGGREISPTPSLHDKCTLNDFRASQHHNSMPVACRDLARLPCALSHMQCVVMKNYLYVIGGCATQCAHGESALNTCYRYDPRFGTWQQMAPMNEKRAYFYACELNCKLYAIGGRNREGAVISCESYDPQLNCWQMVHELPAAYHAHAGAVFDEALYISGGYSQGHFTSDLQVYVPDMDQWEDLSPMNSPRGWHCMCEALGRLYVFGGCQLNDSQQPQPVMLSEYYTPKFDQWTIVAPLSNLHKEASCVKFESFIFVIGGYNVQAKCGQKMVSRYDYENDLWENVGQLGVGQTGVGCCVLDLPWFIFQNNCVSDAIKLDSDDYRMRLAQSNQQHQQSSSAASSTQQHID